MISRWRPGVDPADAERRARSLRARLTAAEEQQEAARRLLAIEPDSFALQLSLQSVDSRRSAVERELTALLSMREREVVNLTLDGPRYVKHSADFLTLSDVLKRLQKLYTAVLQANTEGPTRRGPVTSAVEALSRLRLTEVYPSSFGMSIEVETRPDMFGFSRSVAALEALFALLEAPRTRADLLSSLGEVGPRAGSHYRSLIRALLKSETTASVRWTDPVGNGFDWSAEPGRLAEMEATLGEINTEVIEPKAARGMLLGASLIRNRFEFLTDTPEQVLSGRIAQDARESVRAHFGKHCRIAYQETRVSDQVSGDVRSSLVLTDVALGDQPDVTAAAPDFPVGTD